MPTEHTVKVGIVGKAHGLDGSFYVRQPQARLLKRGTCIKWGDSEEALVIRRSGTDAQPIIKLEGFETRDQAEALRGVQLSVTIDEAPSLGENEYWEHELQGCQVVDRSNKVLGTVTRLLVLPSCEVLEVTIDQDQTQPPQKPQTLLVPMVKDAIKKIDIQSKRIDIDDQFLGIDS